MIHYIIYDSCNCIAFNFVVTVWVNIHFFLILFNNLCICVYIYNIHTHTYISHTLQKNWCNTVHIVIMYDYYYIWNICHCPLELPSFLYQGHFLFSKPLLPNHVSRYYGNMNKMFYRKFDQIYYTHFPWTKKPWICKLLRYTQHFITIAIHFLCILPTCGKCS